MNIHHLSYLVSPSTLLNFKIEINKQEGNNVLEGKLINENPKLDYDINNGIPDLTYPAELKDLDKEFNVKYNSIADSYDEGMNWLFSSFYEREENIRTILIDLLKLKPFYKVLNLGCGTGSDSVYILRGLNKEGKLFNVDLSYQLLKIAKEKLGTSYENVEYLVGNAAYLPFRDNSFDAVFHFGGINMFSEKKRAIKEMTRVTKSGGKVVFGDESVAPWLRNKLYGKIIINANSLYKQRPPVHLLPVNAQNVSIHYLLGHSFYAIDFTVGEIPKLNLDLPIPGKRNGTLRSRYEATGKKINDKKVQHGK